MAFVIAVFNALCHTTLHNIAAAPNSRLLLYKIEFGCR